MDRGSGIIKRTGPDGRRIGRTNEAAMTTGQGRRAGMLVLALAATIGLAACGGTVETRGNLPDAELIAEVEPGRDSREDVVDKLGSPSTVSTFLDRRWYYIGHKTRNVAFFKPEVVERSIFVVSFDGTGLVDDTALYTLEDGQIVDPVSRTTPTEGNELTILQQFFGNFGRFPLEQTQ